MHVLTDLFHSIHTQHETLLEKMQDLDGAAVLLEKAYRDLPDGENPASNTILRSRHRWYKRRLEEKEKVQREYDFSCELARRLLDRVEDGDLALGLQLYGINRMKWQEIAECMGVPDIQERCEKHLEEEDFYFD